MKSLLRFCVFMIVPALWFGFSVNVIYAQQILSVSPEVKADTIRRIEFARTWIMPKQARGAQHIGNGGVEKEMRRVCNEGPKPGDAQTQEEACTSYNIMGGYILQPPPTSLDDLMPTFKLCAISTESYGCFFLASVLIDTGHTEQALAVGEYASGCRGCVYIKNLSSTPQGYSLLLESKSGKQVTITSMADVVQLLKKDCEDGAKVNSCAWYKQIGGSYSEAERQRAEDAQDAAHAAAREAASEQGDRHRGALAASENNLNAIWVP